MAGQLSKIRFWFPLLVTGTSIEWVPSDSDGPTQKMTSQVRMIIKMADKDLSGGFPSFRPWRAKPLLISLIERLFEIIDRHRFDCAIDFDCNSILIAFRLLFRWYSMLRLGAGSKLEMNDFRLRNCEDEFATILSSRMSDRLGLSDPTSERNSILVPTLP